jgi:outer membrane protein TolC
MRYLLWLCLLSMSAGAQQLTLDSCYILARQNYPLIRQYGLINRSGEYSVANAAKGYLPQLTFSGQATYQSDVVHIPLPGNALPELAKDQYKVQAEVDQVIYDGGGIKSEKQLDRANTAVQQQQLEVNLYALKDRVSQLFFGILLADAQLQQNTLLREDLQSGVHKMEGAVTNGAALRSSLDELKAEVLNAQQARTQLNALRKGYVVMLGQFINRPLQDNVTLIKPVPTSITADIKRPELQLYELQRKALDVREQQLHVSYLPKVSAFLQGAYGRPTYNFISNDFGFFGMGGVRFSWALGSLYTHHNSRQLLQLNRQNLDVQQETFLFNTRMSITRQQTDADQYEEMLQQDKEIIALRDSVKNASAAQLENGVITSHDYISEVNAASQAGQQLALHEIQLLQVQYNSRNTSGN